MYLNIENLVSKHGAGLKGIQDLSLNVCPGEVVAILGPNGAGKTTLLETILDWKEANSGSIKFFGGKSFMEDREAILQRVGYVGSEHMLVETYTVAEMIETVRPFYIFWDKGLEAELIHKFKIEKNAVIASLSKGMKIKVSFLLALCFRPDLLVMDEATTGLDPAAREEILQMLVHYCTEESKAVLYATHLLDEVNRVATRTLVLHEGRKKIEFTPEDLDASIVAFDSLEIEKDGKDLKSNALFMLGRNVVFDLRDCSSEALASLQNFNPKNIRLDELFLGITGGVE